LFILFLNSGGPETANIPPPPRDGAGTVSPSPPGATQAVRPPVAEGPPLLTPSRAANGDPEESGGVRYLVTNSIGMTLVRIPAGEFRMGSAASDRQAQEQEKPQHRVQIPKPFYLGAHEVTQAQYRSVMGTNPSHFSLTGGGRSKLSGIASDRLPVETVSWSDAVAFCRRLSNLPEERAAGRTYRLPTEAEWEYACRAGTATVRYFGDGTTGLDAHAVYRDTAEGCPWPVGSKQANPWGLYDMYGNVWEWCSDHYDRNYYRMSPSYNPQGPTTGTSRVLRGGSWWDDSPFCRSANRDFYLPTYRDYEVGFRVVCDVAAP
jgi:formylglycine-generating enzyme required for sulfatase activity